MKREDVRTRDLRTGRDATAAGNTFVGVPHDVGMVVDNGKIRSRVSRFDILDPVVGGLFAQGAIIAVGTSAPQTASCLLPRLLFGQSLFDLVKSENPISGR
jgi:hypothetical protein